MTELCVIIMKMNMGIATTSETTATPDKAMNYGIASRRSRIVWTWLLVFNLVFLVVDLWAWRAGNSALHVHAHTIAVDIARVLGVSASLPHRIWQTFALLGLAIIFFGLSFYL